MSTRQEIDKRFEEIIEEVNYVMNDSVYKNSLIEDKKEYKDSIKTKRDIINMLAPQLVERIEIFSKDIWNIILNYVEEEVISHVNIPHGMWSFCETRYWKGKAYEYPTGYSFFGEKFGINIIYYDIDSNPNRKFHVVESLNMTVIYKKDGTNDIIDNIHYSNVKKEYDISINCHINNIVLTNNGFLYEYLPNKNGIALPYKRHTCYKSR